MLRKIQAILQRPVASKKMIPLKNAALANKEKTAKDIRGRNEKS